MSQDFDQQVAGVAVLSDPVRRALFRHVAASAEPVSREQAADAVGVQRSLAAFHLEKLVEQGLLSFEFRRLTGRTGPGAGRPAKLYRRSDQQIDITMPPREYDLAATLLARAIDDAGAGGDVRRALARAARAFGQQLGREAERRAGVRASARRRRDALSEVLREHGFEPREVDGDVVLANCPFHALSQQFTDLVCGMNLDLMKGVRSEVSLEGDVLKPKLDPAEGRCCVRFCA